MFQWLTNRIELTKRSYAQSFETEEGSSISSINQTKDYGPLDRFARVLYFGLLRLALSCWLTERSKSHCRETPEQKRVRKVCENRGLAAYVVAWLIALVLLWNFGAAGAALVAVVAAFRLLETFTTGLGFVLGMREPRLAGRLITVGMLALQATFIFAILIHSFVPFDCVSGDQCKSGTTARKVELKHEELHNELTADVGAIDVRLRRLEAPSKPPGSDEE